MGTFTMRETTAFLLVGLATFTDLSLALRPRWTLNEVGLIGLRTSFYAKPFSCRPRHCIDEDSWEEIPSGHERGKEYFKHIPSGWSFLRNTHGVTFHRELDRSDWGSAGKRLNAMTMEGDWLV